MKIRSRKWLTAAALTLSAGVLGGVIYLNAQETGQNLAGEVGLHQKQQMTQQPTPAAKALALGVTAPEAKPSKPQPAADVEPFRVVPLDTEVLVATYRDWSDEQIVQELNAFEKEIDEGLYVDRANAGTLDHMDMQKFSDLLLTVDSLIQVQSERQLAELEALVDAGSPADRDEP